MFASTVKLSKDTLALNELTPKQKGEIRYKRLVEASKNGGLSKAVNRQEVANLAGYGEYDQAKGYSWVSNLIHRQQLVEQIDHFDEKTHKVKYLYYLGSKQPNYMPYGGKRGKRGQSEKPENVVKQPIEVPKAIEQNTSTQDEQNTFTQEVTITVNKLNIKFNLSEDKIINLIKDLAKE